MSGSWFEKLLGKRSAARADDTSDVVERRLRELGLRDPLCARAIALQMRYWQTTDETCNSALQELHADATWSERLRRHHQLASAFAAASSPPLWLDAFQLHGDRLSQLRQALRDSSAQLLGPASPFRARHGVVWRGIAPPADGEPAPDFSGLLRARSVAHLGALEVIRLNEAQEPRELDFVAFADLETLAILPETIFAAGLLVKGDSKEPVLIPTRHGLTWWLRDASSCLLPQATAIAGVLESKVDSSARDALWVGLQEILCDDDAVDRGTHTLALNSLYQLTWNEAGCESTATPRPALHHLRLN
jgi:hypothetical protein